MFDLKNKSVLRRHRSSRLDVFCRKGILRNFAKFTGKHLCQSLFFNKVAGAACNFIKKETLAQVFSCEFCEISKNTFFYRTPPVALSEDNTIQSSISVYFVIAWGSYYWILETLLFARTTAQKMKFSIKGFYRKCDQIRRKLRTWSHLLKKSLMQNFFVQWTNFVRTVSLKPTNSKNKLKKTEAKMLKSKAMFFFSIN